MEVDLETVGSLDSRGFAGRKRAISRWHGTAFIVESVLLLAFVAFSLATIANVFAAAHRVGSEADRLSAALMLASTAARNGAETFAADPADESCPTVTYYRLEDGSFAEVESYGPDTFVVRRIVQEQQLEGGVLYRASIIVEAGNETVFTLPTARYVTSNRTDDHAEVTEGVDLEQQISDLGLVPVVVQPDLTDPADDLVVTPTVSLSELHVMERKETAADDEPHGVVVSTDLTVGLHPAVAQGGE